MYQVIWDPSRENGAHIELYCLEGKIEGERRDRREANFTSDTHSAARIEDDTAIEADDDSDNWVPYYNGTGMKHKYIFCFCNTEPFHCHSFKNCRVFRVLLICLFRK